MARMRHFIGAIITTSHLAPLRSYPSSSIAHPSLIALDGQPTRRRRGNRTDNRTRRRRRRRRRQAEADDGGGEHIMFESGRRIPQPHTHTHTRSSYHTSRDRERGRRRRRKKTTRSLFGWARSFPPSSSLLLRCRSQSLSLSLSPSPLTLPICALCEFPLSTNFELERRSFVRSLFRLDEDVLMSSCSG